MCKEGEKNKIETTTKKKKKTVTKSRSIKLCSSWLRRITRWQRDKDASNFRVRRVIDVKTLIYAAELAVPAAAVTL